MIVRRHCQQRSMLRRHQPTLKLQADHYPLIPRCSEAPHHPALWGRAAHFAAPAVAEGVPKRCGFDYL